ncbi:MAG TPA: tRNA (adenosine(37)-N6)-threonylcarbamoyltransferase complex ATPase subunit type 1 TsaE [Bacteroidia bacterium]|nr:tRNA (adenosine(37)-N6)-threonylcarbamoyltransferase complex ATPase subunit type 1 TsaE [Bacteroidia bacterium]
MSKLELDISDLGKLPDACKKLIDFAGNIKLFAFNAEMGAGKTTFIKQLCLVLGSQDNFSSPTYSIVNEYQSSKNKIYHFDFYRIKTTEEIVKIGFDDYIFSGNYCFIEWPDLALSLLPKPYLSIVIDHQQNNRYLYAQIIE